MIKLRQIDISKIEGCNHPDIKEDTQYLAKIDGDFYAGYFEKQWYGWNFNAVYSAGYQLDYEDWEGLWEIEEIK